MHVLNSYSLIFAVALRDRISYSQRWPLICYVAKESLGLLIPLTPPPECWVTDENILALVTLSTLRLGLGQRLDVQPGFAPSLRRY